MSIDNLKILQTTLKAIIQLQESIGELSVCVLASGQACRELVGAQQFETAFDRHYKEAKQSEEAKAADLHLQALRELYRQLSSQTGRD